MNRKVVYVAAPLAGDVEANLEFAKRASIFAVKQGVTPYMPHFTFPTILNDTIPEERQLGISLNKDMLAKCDELWMFTEHGISPGMAIEQETAMQLGIPILMIGNLGAVEHNKLNPQLTAKNSIADLRCSVTQAERDAALENLWKEFRHVPFNNDAPNIGATTLAKNWRWFPKGTTRKNIQSWFGARHSKGLLYLIEKDLMSATDEWVSSTRELEADCPHRGCCYNKNETCAFAEKNNRPAHQTYACGCIDREPVKPDA